MSYTPTAPRGTRGDYAGGRGGSGAGGDAEKDEAAEVQKLQSAGFSRGALYSKILSPLSESSIILYGHNSPGTVAQDFKEGRDKKAPYLSRLTHRIAPDELVTFIVGEHKQRFTIHEEFVCYHSPVLSAAVNGCFMEGTTKTCTLDDIAPKNSDYSPNTSMPTKSRSRSMRQEPATGCKQDSMCYSFSEALLLCDLTHPVKTMGYGWSGFGDPSPKSSYLHNGQD
ncbi:hypothetical protein WAI453_007099 [Rhynchosporium graminicola]|uniref:BTB domain-containing protein n=1 Tax=Rhynchosporium graminicola TaxID=2792576 RepID=A0A1E1LHB4_9HELO|nr:uncharacterized protein RCO7_02236 [Rhynchosporium commune]